MPLNSNLAFSQTHGGSYLFYSDASTVELEIASGGITVDGTGTFGGDISVQDSSYLRVRATGDNASTAVQLGPDGTGSFASGALSISNVGNITTSGRFQSDRSSSGDGTYRSALNGVVKHITYADGTTKIGSDSDAQSSPKITLSADGSATFASNTTVGAPDVANASTGGVQLFASGQLRIQRNGAGSASDKRFQMYYGTAETVAITADGAAYFKSVAAKSTFNLTNETTSGKIQLSSDISGNYTGWKEKGVASGSMSQASIDSKTPMLTDFTYPNASDGMLIWSTSKIGFAAGSESPQFGVGVQMLFDSSGLALGGVRAFDRTSAVNSTTDAKIKLFTNGSAEFAGSIDLTDSTIDLYSQTTNGGSKTFQLFSDIGGTKTEKLFVNASGDIATEGAITFTGQTNTTATGSSATSDAFDHYEEGTFTPAMDVSGTSGTISISYSNQVGRYTRIGRMCFCTIDIRLSSFSRGTGTGGIMIVGLPFQPVDSGNFARAQGSLHLYNWNYGATTAGDAAIATVKQNGTPGFVDIRLHRYGNTDADVSDPSNNSMLFATIAYEVA
jgi:hypothetical protein